MAKAEAAKPPPSPPKRVKSRWLVPPSFLKKMTVSAHRAAAKRQVLAERAAKHKAKGSKKLVSSNSEEISSNEDVPVHPIQASNNAGEVAVSNSAGVVVVEHDPALSPGAVIADSAGDCVAVSDPLPVPGLNTKLSSLTLATSTIASTSATPQQQLVGAARDPPQSQHTASLVPKVIRVEDFDLIKTSNPTKVAQDLIDEVGNRLRTNFEGSTLETETRLDNWLRILELDVIKMISVVVSVESSNMAPFSTGSEVRDLFKKLKAFIAESDAKKATHVDSSISLLKKEITKMKTANYDDVLDTKDRACRIANAFNWALQTSHLYEPLKNEFKVRQKVGSDNPQPGGGGQLGSKAWHALLDCLPAKFKDFVQKRVQVKVGEQGGKYIANMYYHPFIMMDILKGETPEIWIDNEPKPESKSKKRPAQTAEETDVTPSDGQSGPPVNFSLPPRNPPTQSPPFNRKTTKKGGSPQSSPQTGPPASDQKPVDAKPDSADTGDIGKKRPARGQGRKRGKKQKRDS